jgi:hypothetical protein
LKRRRQGENIPIPKLTTVADILGIPKRPDLVMPDDEKMAEPPPSEIPSVATVEPYERAIRRMGVQPQPHRVPATTVAPAVNLPAPGPQLRAHLQALMPHLYPPKPYKHIQRERTRKHTYSTKDLRRERIGTFTEVFIDENRFEFVFLPGATKKEKTDVAVRIKHHISELHPDVSINLYTIIGGTHHIVLDSEDLRTIKTSAILSTIMKIVPKRSKSVKRVVLHMGNARGGSLSTVVGHSEAFKQFLMGPY